MNKKDKPTTHLVGGGPHELFGRGLPDGGYGDDPSHVLVENARAGLVRQLTESVVLEEPQRVGEHGERRHGRAVIRLDLRVLVEVL